MRLALCFLCGIPGMGFGRRRKYSQTKPEMLKNVRAMVLWLTGRAIIRCLSVDSPTTIQLIDSNIRRRQFW